MSAAEHDDAIDGVPRRSSRRPRCVPDVSAHRTPGASSPSRRRSGAEAPDVSARPRPPASGRADSHARAATTGKGQIDERLAVVAVGVGERARSRRRPRRDRAFSGRRGRARSASADPGRQGSVDAPRTSRRCWERSSCRRQSALGAIERTRRRPAGERCSGRTSTRSPSTLKTKRDVGIEELNPVHR